MKQVKRFSIGLFIILVAGVLLCGCWDKPKIPSRVQKFDNIVIMKKSIFEKFRKDHAAIMKLIECAALKSKYDAVEQKWDVIQVTHCEPFPGDMHDTCITLPPFLIANSEAWAIIVQAIQQNCSWAIDEAKKTYKLSQEAIDNIRNKKQVSMPTRLP